MTPRLVIAGTHSGVGKTTITVGLIAALRRRGLAVQPFKCGPDFIDPTHHARAAGRPCRNLDTWMVPAVRLPELFDQEADIHVIEGVMGLFDGLGYDEDTASTAQIAKWLRAPVILVVDVSKQARSAAALAQGFCRFDPELTLAGFVLNRVGSDSHGQGTARAIEKATGLPVFGWLPRQEKLLVPERHLGLVPAVEPGGWDDWIAAAAEQVAAHVDVDRVLAIANGAPEFPMRSQPGACDPNINPFPRPVIAIARDEAFHFMYEENLELLRAAGADLAFFSPMRDDELPPGTQGLILSGGFPEVFARELSINKPMRKAIFQAHDSGMPIYAECGGLMYLTESIMDVEGRSHPMVGVLPGFSAMSPRVTLGYRLARVAGHCWLAEKGATLRGHEFHYSTWQKRPHHLPPAYFLVSPTVASDEARPEGACLGNLLASYVHVHFWNMPEWGPRFVEAAMAFRDPVLTSRAAFSELR